MFRNQTSLIDIKGFSLVEVLIAICILGISSTGFYLAANSLSSAKYKTEVVSQALILDEMLQASLTTYVPTTSLDRDLLKQDPAPSAAAVGALIKINTPGFSLSTNAADYTHDFNNQNITLVSSSNNKIQFRLQTITCVNGVKSFGFGYKLEYLSSDERMPTVNWRSGTADAASVNLAAADCKLSLPTSVFSNAISCPIDPNTDTSVMVGFDKNRGLPYCLKKQDPVPQNEIQTGYQIYIDPVTLEQKISPLVAPTRSLSCGLSTSAPFKAISALNIVSMVSDGSAEAYTYGSGPQCESSVQDIPNIFTTSWATYFTGIYRYGESGLNYFRSPVVPLGTEARISFSNACPPGYDIDQASVNCRVYTVPGNVNIGACQASYPSVYSYSKAVFTYTSPVTTTTLASNYELRLMSYGCRVR